MKYTAIIIEPRIHNALEFVLNNFLNNLDENWLFIIFYGTYNKNYLFDIIKNNFLNIINRITLINLSVSNLTIYDYNHILFNLDFYKFIKTQYFLIFQTDSLIRLKYKYYINYFFEYDYVGAPWENPTKIFNKNDCNNVGNGGLSLRNKDKMIEIINKYFIKSQKCNEDYFFVKKRDDLTINLPSLEGASYFSIESLYNEESFGVHKPWLYLTPEDYNKLITISPEIYNLELLNKEYNNNNNKETKIIGKLEFILETLI